MAKSSKKRKKKKSGGGFAVFLAVVTVIVLSVSVVYMFRHRVQKGLDGVREKADSLIPNGFTYPTEYEEYVIKYSNEFDVDPVLVFSVIKVESNFTPDAESSVGARGLMQLMSDAYDWVKFRLEDDSPSFDDMYDPEKNIEYGTYYLSYLMEKYDGSVDLTAAAYHCGMGMVDGWLADGTIDAENFDVADIPEENDQTAHYVNKINAAYSAYEDILAERDSTDLN